MKSPSQPERLCKIASRSTVHKNEEFWFGLWNSFIKFYHFDFEYLVNMSTTVFINKCCSTCILCSCRGPLRLSKFISEFQTLYLAAGGRGALKIFRYASPQCFSPLLQYLFTEQNRIAGEPGRRLGDQPDLVKESLSKVRKQIAGEVVFVR
jgi:hypothetical protein